MGIFRVDELFFISNFNFHKAMHFQDVFQHACEPKLLYINPWIKPMKTGKISRDGEKLE